MNRITYAVASLGLALVACRGGDDGPSGDDTVDIDAPPVAVEVTIQEVQNDAMPSGTPIELKGVVVTAIDIFGGRTGEFFVSEPGGGPNSGVKVFGARTDMVASIAVGDLVDITGAIKHEGCTAAAPCGTIVFDNGASITEVMGASQGSLVVTKVGTGTVPPPAEVDASAISLLATPALRDAEWEKWEGVLVKVIKARQIGTVDPFSGADSEPDQFEFRATGFVRVQSGLSALPATSVLGTCYESMTGVLDFFFNYSLQPRSAADLVTGGTACRPMATTVAMIQTMANVEMVSLTNVFVTGRDDIAGTGMTASYGYWIADAATGAANNGVFVFTRADMAPAGAVIGARIATLGGGVTEFDLGSGGNPAMGNTITEITSPTVPTAAQITAPTGPGLTPATPPVAELADIGANGEKWEGVLVTTPPLKITNIAAGGGKIELSDASTPPVKLHIDDDSFVLPAQTLNNCVRVTGLMNVAIFDDLRTINPRNAADVATVAAAMCN